MSVMIRGIELLPGNSDLYQVKAHMRVYDGFESIDDYVATAAADSGYTPIRECDEEYELVTDMDGRICRQDGGRVIGWITPDGDVRIEVAYQD